VNVFWKIHLPPLTMEGERVPVNVIRGRKLLKRDKDEEGKYEKKEEI
jgi:hypothetical protein